MKYNFKWYFMKKIKGATLLVSLIFLSTFVTLSPTAKAAELDLQTKTMSILGDVINLDMEKYTVTQNAQTETLYLGQNQKEIDIYLSSSEGSLRVTCSFIKDNLQLLYISDLKGQPAIKKLTTNTIDMAKDLLERYQVYSDSPVYGACASMLKNVDASNNFTISENNIKFEVSIFDQKIVNYKWTYIDSNGIIAERKNIVLNYEDGQLKFFLNNWALYNVAGTPKLSAEEANDIAIEASKNFSYEVTNENGSKQIVSGFTIAKDSEGDEELVYQNFDTEDSARGGDPFTLYPTWVVPLGFDKFYPGDVSSMIVYIWADTGEVNYMQEVVVDSNLLDSNYTVIEDQSQASVENTEESTILSIQITIILSFCSLGALISNRKRVSRLLSSKNLKSCIIGLCISIICIAQLLSVPLASAEVDPQSKSEIYACIHTPNGYHSQTVDDAEKEASKTVCDYIEDVTLDAGYSVSNWCWDPGYGTTVNRVGQNAHNDELNYDRTAVFYVGHKASDNFAIQDDQGYSIDWQDIGTNTTLGEHFFVFLWVCNQAQAPTYGIPANWTQNPNMSSDGYANPDYDGQCYISFLGYSPMISSYPESEGHPTFYGEGYLGPCQEFIIFFYYRAVTQNYSVHDALNFASTMYFSDSYTNSVLNQGYSCWWPGNGPGNLTYSGYFPEDFRQYQEFQNTPDNRMRVFGDSSIKLYQPLLTLSASSGLSPTFTIDGQSQNVGSCRLVPGTYTVTVSDVPNYSFSHFSYKGSTYSRPANIQIASDGELVANYVFNPAYYTLSVSTTGGGTTNASASQSCLSYSTQTIVATPNSGKILGYWVKDGQVVGSGSSLTVEMDGAHTVQAVFIDPPPYVYVSGITGYNEQVTTPNGMAGPATDGYEAHLISYGPYDIFGSISGSLNQSASGRVYIYGHGYGTIDIYTSAGYLNRITPSSTTSSWIDCGVASSAISSITLLAQDTSSFTDFYIDAIRVDSRQYTLTTSVYSGSGTVSPSGNNQYLIGTTVSVSETPASGYLFDHWILDGNNAGSSTTISVTMNEPHTLQAVFTQAPPAYVNGITGSSGMTYNTNYMIGQNPDGYYAEMYDYWDYDIYSGISASLNTITSGHVYVYGCGSGTTYVCVSSDGSNWNYLATINNPGSPCWIDCGTYNNNIDYIAFFGGSSYNTFYIDCVHVQP
jgi:hypothetical protein